MYVSIRCWWAGRRWMNEVLRSSARWLTSLLVRARAERVGSDEAKTSSGTYSHMGEWVVTEMVGKNTTGEIWNLKSKQDATHATLKTQTIIMTHPSCCTCLFTQKELIKVKVHGRHNPEVNEFFTFHYKPFYRAWQLQFYQHCYTQDYCAQ